MRVEGGTEADRAAIAALHRADEAASLAGDNRALRALMSDEAVVLAPGAPALRGREALDRAFGQGGAAGEEVLAYAFRWEELTILGDLAIEWGRIEGRSRPAGTGGPGRAEAHNVLRVLRREAGGWKVFRTIWNDAPA